MDKVKRGVFVGYVLNAGGGWTGDIDILDAVELSNAQLHSEATCRRINFKEIDVDKDAKEDFIFPVLSEEWEQPSDSKNMTRTIRKKIFNNDQEDQTSLSTAAEEARIKRKERRKERKRTEEKQEK